MKEMWLTAEKVKSLWDRLQRHRTLFTDFTRGDVRNWIYSITNPDTYWLEIWREDELVGLIAAMNFKLTDAEVHIMILDRKPVEKIEVYRAVMKHLFDNFPLHRITVVVPYIYFNTRKLALRMGFREEGVKKQAVAIGGRWVDQYIFGMLRNELWA